MVGGLVSLASSRLRRHSRGRPELAGSQRYGDLVLLAAFLHNLSGMGAVQPPRRRRGTAYPAIRVGLVAIGAGIWYFVFVKAGTFCWPNVE